LGCFQEPHAEPRGGEFSAILLVFSPFVQKGRGLGPPRIDAGEFVPYIPPVDTIRYVMAALIVATLPPAGIFWLFIHPFAGFWRKRGPWITYMVVGAASLALVLLAWLNRAALMGTDLGFRPLLAASGVGLYFISIQLEIKCRKHLKFNVLAGLPEIAPDRMESELLDQGIYGRVRHPRYLAILVGVLAWALFSAYTGAIWVALGMIPLLYLVTVFEEIELVQRFGDEYLQYRERVPRLIPRPGG